MSPVWELAPGVSRTKGLARAITVFTWMETYIRIRTKSGATVAFRFNDAQMALAQDLARHWHKNLPWKVFIPKARQEGVSTWVCALGFTMAELFPGYQCALTAHVEASALEIFGKYKTMLRSLKDWPIELVSDQGGQIRWADDSALHSASVRAGDSLLKGFTVNFAHWSEAANFADAGIDTAKAIAAAQPSIVQNELTIEIYESTANGKDAFFYGGCEAAKDPNSGSEYSIVFLPWLLMKEYSMTWEDYRRQFTERGKADPGAEFIPTAEEEIFRRKMASVQVQPGEENWKYRFDVTDEQLIWRRNEMSKPWCAGREDLFRRYFPATYEECFTTSASCFFAPHDIDYYRERSRDPYARGLMRDAATRPVFQTSPEGYIVVWDYPLPGTDYVIGADPGGESRTADPCAAYVLKRDSHEIVAALHGHMEWDTFADQLYMLGQFYNWAELAVENNVSRAVVKRLARRSYGNLYYAIDDVTAEGSKTVPGFNTNRRTRPELLDVLDKAVRLRALRSPDRGLVHEMETFNWVPKASNPREGTYKATGRNHDDRIMSLGIALMLCPEPADDYDFSPLKEKTVAQKVAEYLFADEDTTGYTQPLNLARSTDAPRQ